MPSSSDGEKKNLILDSIGMFSLIFILHLPLNELDLWVYSTKK